MKSQRRLLAPLACALAVQSAVAAPTPHPAVYRPPWLSAAGELLFREELARGRYQSHPLARWYARSTWSEAAESEIPRRIAPLTTALGLALDARVNDRVPLTCANCLNLPITQCEPTVAVDGTNILVGWNDYEPFQCGGPSSRQNYGYSIDGGVSFVDGNGWPANDVGTRFGGDPVHAVNHKTQRFYVGGLVGGGVGGLEGHFSGSSFVLDANRRVVTGIPAVEFLDKPWMNVDSLSGHVYFAWSNFPSYGESRIEFQSFDQDLNPVGPKLSLSDTSATSCGSQFSQIAVGPEGEVWVSWLQYDCPTGRIKFLARRSDDFGTSFGPPRLIAFYDVNSFNGPPGMHRHFASYQPSLAMDCSHGPHRGRLYAAWDQSLRLPILGSGGDASVVEQEPNDTTASATYFVPGTKIRGIKLPGESDWFRFDLSKGQTFYLLTNVDSMNTAFNARLWCPGGGGGLEMVANGTTFGLLYGAPHDGSYYLQIFGANPDTIAYVFPNFLLTPDSGDPALDHRDQFASWSDNGITWSTPHRLNDSEPGFDGVFPTLAVDGRGRVHCFWLDFRDDPVCGAASSEYAVSSGDGGVTWGPNRRIGDAVAFWPVDVCVGSSGNTQGDYIHMAADGDRVVAAFTATPLGDPDIFVDPSFHHALAACPPEVRGVSGRDTLVEVGLVNEGNYARELAWRFEETEGWLTGVVPAPSGLTTLAPGETLHVRGTLHLDACVSESTLVRFVHADPAIPGYEDTCSAWAHCGDGSTSALAVLISSRAGPDEVTLEWYVPAEAGSPARVWRRDGVSASVAVGAPEDMGSERWRYVDRAVEPGKRYGYRLETPSADGPSFSPESWIEVPAGFGFALDGLRPNPASGDLEILFSLATAEPARVDIFDVSGRRLLARELRALGPGPHRVRLDETGRLVSGIYTVLLRQAGKTASARAVVIR